MFMVRKDGIWTTFLRSHIFTKEEVSNKWVNTLQMEASSWARHRECVYVAGEGGRGRSVFESDFAFQIYSLKPWKALRQQTAMIISVLGWQLEGGKTLETQTPLQLNDAEGLNWDTGWRNMKRGVEDSEVGAPHGHEYLAWEYQRHKFTH